MELRSYFSQQYIDTDGCMETFHSNENFVSSSRMLLKKRGLAKSVRVNQFFDDPFCLAKV